MIIKLHFKPHCVPPSTRPAMQRSFERRAKYNKPNLAVNTSVTTFILFYHKPARAAHRAGNGGCPYALIAVDSVIFWLHGFMLLRKFAECITAPCIQPSLIELLAIRLLIFPYIMTRALPHPLPSPRGRRALHPSPSGITSDLPACGLSRMASRSIRGTEGEGSNLIWKNWHVFWKSQ